ncbi:MAG: nuclear transport factor 2 family protein [Sphingomonas sp.]|nr:nuclear transport factor 2 family protein [Sphingomonas sp.]
MPFPLFAILAAHALQAPAAIAPNTVDPAAAKAAAVVDRFHAALEAGDGKAAMLLLADEALVFESGHVEEGKAEYQALHLDGDIAYLRGVKDRTLSRTGRAAGKLAWIATQGQTSGTYNGKPVDRASTETMVLRRIAGQWRIVHIHWSSSAR